VFVIKDPPPPECPDSVVLEEPENGQEVGGVTGVAIAGTVCGLRSGDTATRGATASATRSSR
jgi:hypothetical protein